MNFQTLQTKIEENVASIIINRPEKANSMNKTFWEEIKKAFEWADMTPEVRVVVLSGHGKHFSSGIDLELFAEIATLIQGKCVGRNHENLRQMILNFQSSFNAIEKCRKPVIAAIHGACVGGAVDMISACDMRYGTQDSFFSIKEIDLGMIADVGTLQRLPHIIPAGIVRELAYTGRKVKGVEAEKIGLINKCFDTQVDMMEEVNKIAKDIASKSPLAIRGIKEMILYTRDHTVQEGLNYVATWNGSALASNDVKEAIMAQMEKRSPNFDN